MFAHCANWLDFTIPYRFSGRQWHGLFYVRVNTSEGCVCVCGRHIDRARGNWDRLGTSLFPVRSCLTLEKDPHLLNVSCRGWDNKIGQCAAVRKLGRELLSTLSREDVNNVRVKDQNQRGGRLFLAWLKAPPFFLRLCPLAQRLHPHPSELTDA